MKNISNTKLIILYPYIQKQGTSNHLWLLAFMSIFTLAFLLTIIYTNGLYAYSSTTTITISAATITTTTTASTAVPLLPTTVINTLLYYTPKSNDTFKMSYADIKPISDALRKCSTPCNFLIFGLTHETLLWKALNNNGCTVFIDENRYFAAYTWRRNTWKLTRTTCSTQQNRKSSTSWWRWQKSKYGTSAG
ncbi:hypothetical protein PRUPE_7G074500 [Prunus persica]|uniref:Uncharacterized protein n=1 Tax=Prunus persica TaxID=3760 RepID=M5VWQ7_PRUPE|nr:protein IRX15-LIKE [Prunus persica]ONH95496.1 hypothetical protein PRUPE_7G074500 [Prunus persica]